MTSRRQQRDHKPDPLDLAALEHELRVKRDLPRLERELHAADPPNRKDRRATARTAAYAEAESIARPTGHRVTGRPTMGAGA